MTASFVVTPAVTLQASLEAPAPLVDTLPSAGTPEAKDLGNESKSDILPEEALSTAHALLPGCSAEGDGIFLGHLLYGQELLQGWRELVPGVVGVQDHSKTA